MDIDSVNAFIDELLGSNTERKYAGSWVSIHCPFAQWTHEHGTDLKASAGILVTDNGEPSVFNCFTCGNHTAGNLKRMVEQYEEFTGYDFSEIKEGLVDSDEFSSVLHEWGRTRRVVYGYRKEIDDSYLDLYDSAIGHSYLRRRGVNDETAELLELVLDPSNNGVERILFPIRYRDGVLAGFTGRATNDNATPKVRDYHGLKKESVLLGLHLIAKTDKYVVVVEGPFDYAIMTQYGYPTVAALFAGLTDNQLKGLVDLGMPILLMYDNDRAGRSASDKVAGMLSRHLPVSVVRYSLWDRIAGRAKDPATLSKKEAGLLVEKAALWTGNT